MPNVWIHEDSGKTKSQTVGGDMLKNINRAENDELMNWGRAIRDDWLEDHLMYAPPPTSEGYIAPVVAWDTPEPVRDVTDEIAAQRTSDIVVYMGLHHIDYYKALVHWYPHRGNIRSLSMRLKCSKPSAERILCEAVERYWDMRQCHRHTA
jgi:hypothetical protein